jgi:hypothetical protein
VRSACAASTAAWSATSSAAEGPDEDADDDAEDADDALFVGVEDRLLLPVDGDAVFSKPLRSSCACASVDSALATRCCAVSEFCRACTHADDAVFDDGGAVVVVVLDGVLVLDADDDDVVLVVGACVSAQTRPASSRATFAVERALSTCCLPDVTARRACASAAGSTALALGVVAVVAVRGVVVEVVRDPLFDDPEGPDEMPFRALFSVSWAAAKLACLAVRAASRVVVSSVANVCAVLTVCPGCTATVDTVPAIGKATVPWAMGSMVPLRCSVWLTLARFTSAVRNDEFVEPESASACPASRAAASTTMATATKM